MFSGVDLTNDTPTEESNDPMGKHCRQQLQCKERTLLVFLKIRREIHKKCIQEKNKAVLS